MKNEQNENKYTLMDEKLKSGRLRVYHRLTILLRLDTHRNPTIIILAVTRERFHSEELGH